MSHAATIRRYFKTQRTSTIRPMLVALFVCALIGGCHQAGPHVVSNDFSATIDQTDVVPPEPGVISTETFADTATPATSVTPIGSVALLGIEPFRDPATVDSLPPLLSADWSPTASAAVPVTSASIESGNSVNNIGQDGCYECRRFTFKEDKDNFFSMLRDDARGVVNRDNALVLGVGLAGALVMRKDLDKRVRDGVQSSPLRWGEGSKTLGHLADPQYQVPVIMAVYAHSLRTQNEELHEFSESLISAFTITGLSTLGVKAIANTDRPSPEWNGGQYGFPSYHAASSFSMAAVVDEYYGPSAAVPAYALAGLIGWSRIDEQDHDLSDVVFGSVLGYVIGKSVAQKHRTGDSRLRMLPYVHPTDGTTGLLFDWPF
jgi:hypothetical protein